MPIAKQTSFAGGELSPSLAAQINLDKYAIGCETLLNFVASAHGGASTRPGTLYVGTAPGQGILYPFTFSVTQAYMLEFTDQKIRIIKNGAYVQSAGVPIEVVTPYIAADLSELRFTQSADVLFITHPSYSPRKLSRTAETSWTLDVISFVSTLASVASVTTTPASPAVQTYSYVVTAHDGATLGSSSAAATVTVPSPFSGTVAVSWTAIPGAVGYEVKRNGSLIADTTNTSFTDTGVSIVAAGYAAGGPLLSPVITNTLHTVATPRTYKYCVTTTDSGGQESDPSSPVSVSITYPWPANTVVGINWTLPGSGETGTGCNIYKNFRGQWGYIGYCDHGDKPFVDDNITADVTRAFPGDNISDFTASGDHPGSVTIFQQRLIFARSNNLPQTLWGSQLGQFYNFADRVALQDNDAFAATLASTQVNEIKHLVPLAKLLVFTSDSEWFVDSGSNADAVGPKSIRFSLQGQRGCSSVRPVVIGNTVLFVQRSGKIIRDMFYQLAEDGYTGDDLTIMAKHLFESNTIVSMAYQQHPDSVLWCVRDDGVLLGLTYMREHRVFAWHRHTTDGYFESVASIPTSGGDDEVYFIVRRTVGGVTKRFVEKLATRLPDVNLVDHHAVDCGVFYNGTPVTTVTGLTHIEGKEVVIVADGDVIRNKTVSGGAVTLPRAASKVHVGLPFTCDLRTMNLEFSDPDGTSQPKKKCVKKVTMRVKDSRGAMIGPDENNLIEAKWRTDEDYDEVTQLFTGDKLIAVKSIIKDECRVFVRQADPLPLTVLALFAEVQAGG